MLTKRDYGSVEACIIHTTSCVTRCDVTWPRLAHVYLCPLAGCNMETLLLASALTLTLHIPAFLSILVYAAVSTHDQQPVMASLL